MKNDLRPIDQEPMRGEGQPPHVARSLARLFLLVLFIGVLLVMNPFQKEEVAQAAPMPGRNTTPAASNIARTFSLRYDVLSTGANLKQIGNSLTTCNSNNLRISGTLTCGDTQTGSDGPQNSWYNDDYNIVYVNQDTDSNTFDSSSADVTNGPASFTVLRAELYWGGSFNPSTLGNQNLANTMMFKGPTGAYQNVTADQIDSIDVTVGSRVGRSYGAEADITSLFTANNWMNGTYWGANVQATTGCTSGNDTSTNGCQSTQSAGNGSLGNYAGWALLLVYKDLNDTTVRYVGINDGFTCVVQGATGCPQTLTVNFTGFNIPPNVIANERWGLLAWDGDTGNGDGFKLNNVQESDNAHLISNYFRSRISKIGTNVTTRNPSFVNNLGMDQVEQTDLNLPAGSTSVPGEFTTTSPLSELVLQHYFWIVAETTATDYSDAPTSYGIVSHDISTSATTLRMGTATTDPETGMINTGGFATTATGDDQTGTDDEDGATFGFIPGQTTYKVKVHVQNAFSPAATANLYGWIDFNQNGVFDDTEAATATIAANTTSDITLTWTGKPSFAAGATLYARFRLTTNTLTDTGGTADTRAVGNATNGEVEDYRITIQPNPTSNLLNKFIAKNKGNDIQLHWQTANEVNLAGFDVWRQSGNGDWKQMNKNIIEPKNPGDIAGAKYKFTDKTVKAGKTYQYKLQILAAKGAPEWSDVVNILSK